MQLRLKAQAAYANETPPPIEGLFDTAGGTLGRDPRCQMVLVDPMRRISRIQAQIVWENNAFHLLNASTSNPIYVNGRELGPGGRSVIGAKEEWRTGNYLIDVEQLASAAPTMAEATVAAHTVSAAASAPLQEAIPQTPSPLDSMDPLASFDPLQTSALSPVEHSPFPEPLIPAPATATAAEAVPAAVPAVVPAITAAPNYADLPSPASVMKGPFDDLLGAPVAPDAAATPFAPSAQTGHEHLPDDPFAMASLPTPQPMRAPIQNHSVGDPFADLMGAPIDSHMSNAPAHPLHHGGHAPRGSATANVIPDDFNPLALRGVSPRNMDDPLSDLLNPGNVKDMFPERSLDAIFQPTEGSIDSMTVDPLQAAHHQSFMDASTRVDPLAIFSEERTEDALNPEMLFGNPNVREKTQSDHTSELGSYFRAPRALHDASTSGSVDDPLQAFSQAPALPADLDPLAPLAPVAPVAPVVPFAQNAPIAPNMVIGGSFADSPAPVDQGLHVTTTTTPPATSPQPIHSPAAPSGQPGASSNAVNLDAFFDLSGAPDNALMGLDAVPVAAPMAAPPVQAQEASLTPHPVGVPPAQVATEPTPSPPLAPLDDNAQQLLDAFKRGAGLNDCRYPQQLTPEMMFMIGQMLGNSVQGCMDLLSSRAAAKQEVRIAVTLINAEANNPLKFLPTGAAALAQIFGPRMPGFLSGPAAIENAHLDLRAHEVGMMAGTQAAVQRLFERFDPQEIEQQLDAQGRQRTLFAAQRSARLWEMYCSRFQWLKEEMKNQTPASWGTEFHSAYQNETDSIDRKGPRK
ncbi:type VI secretion system-associated FHA domain protein TagH [Diaphorobacter caeni]|uniref:type VI secretion system-associated FHA domain protein TagH n=1 Tax=Diaphorobacter caeni TaxID=2784387 RepID=UPI00188DF48C|nr:type VI secretion system-associated FHA domain protein TagH [Diaphorobacter caeni]MBF5005914.1 type VI secretion system-associated FHA domain protein TagH [Diaphorobacter caeni]